MNDRFSAVSFLVLLLTLASIPLRGQERMPPDDVLSGLQEKLSAYSATNPTSNLYLHLDKTVYTPEETLWFKAYLLGDVAQESKVLYVRIVDEEKIVVAEEQFPIYDVRSHGSINIYHPGNTRILSFGGLYSAPPKILLEGRYMLYAYTDRMVALGDTNVFVQPIRINRMTGRRLEATASVTDTTLQGIGDQVRIKVDVRQSGARAAGIRGEYRLLADGKVLEYGRLTTNAFGEAFVNFTYPDLSAQETVRAKLLFTVENDHAELTLNLPHRGNPLIIKSLLEGRMPFPGGDVNFIVQDVLGNPVRTSLRVMSGDSTVADVITDTLGIATVALPLTPSVRYVVVTADGRGRTTLDVPSADRLEGFSLKLRHDSTGSNILVKNHGDDHSVLLVLRSHNEILWRSQEEIQKGDSVTILVPARKFNKDVLSMAVFGLDGNLKAERLFLNREDDDYHLSIGVDRQDYGVRQRVIATLRAIDNQGQPVIANLSIAATLKSRRGGVPSMDILRYWHLTGLDMRRERMVPIGVGTAVFNRLLTGRGWYESVPDGLSQHAAGSISDRKFRTDGVTGFAKSVNFPKSFFYPVQVRRKIKEVEIRAFDGLVLKKEKLESSFRQLKFPVDQRDNSFFIPDSVLVSMRGQEWSLRIPDRGPFHFLYMVDWKDPAVEFDSLLIAGRRLNLIEPMDRLVVSRTPIPSGFDFHGINLLDEVVIGARKRARRMTLRRTNCQCYDDMIMDDLQTDAPRVAIKEWLRLRKGMTYPWGFTLDREPRLIIYLGCGRYRDINYLRNITLPEDFPLPDYDTSPATELDMRSTVYWHPNVYTDADGMATFSFFTSDVTGEFEIVAQGLVESTLRPLMGTGSFKVESR